MIYNKFPVFTVQEFQDNFDELFERVEKGKETLAVVDKDGNEFIITPYQRELEILLSDIKDGEHG